MDSLSFIKSIQKRDNTSFIMYKEGKYSLDGINTITQMEILQKCKRLGMIHSDVEHLFKVLPKTLHSEYEDPNGYYLLTDLLESVEGAAKIMSHYIPKKPFIGTQARGKISARIIPNHLAKENIILFERELFVFVNLLSKILCEILPNEVISADSINCIEMVKSIDENPQILKRVWDLLSAYIFEGHVSLSYPYILSKNKLQLQYQLTRSIELFILSHEYAHLLLKHSQSLQDIKGVLNKENRMDTQKLLSRFHQKFEYQADETGLMIAHLAINDKGDAKYTTFVGVFFYFAFFEMIEKILRIFGEGSYSCNIDTHPSFSSRSKKLSKVINKGVLEEMNQSLRFLNSSFSNVDKKLTTKYGNDVIKIKNHIEIAVQHLWMQIKPKMHKANRQGIEVNQMWRDNIK
ncbi:hypothetical protein [Peribacillus simplex]|uniref:hypothetical protein n=1 Tax=Peribacillus simplex TaxID=1478 RepID=UPI00119F7C5D|nr:hypothetical protein [Peribacillus simplex]